MTELVSITIDDRQLQAALRRLEHAGLDLAPAMRDIAQGLLLETEQNFEAEGRPRWKGLADSTKEARRRGAKGKRGQEVFRILQDSGQLAASIETDYDSHQAVIGSNKAYARIHQFGGMAGRGRKVEIPARPYLPIEPDGSLQPQAKQTVLDSILDHLRRAAGV